MHCLIQKVDLARPHVGLSFPGLYFYSDPLQLVSITWYWSGRGCLVPSTAPHLILSAYLKIVQKGTGIRFFLNSICFMIFWFEILRLVKKILFWNVERVHNVSAECVAHIIYKGTISDYCFEPCTIGTRMQPLKNVIQYIYVQEYRCIDV
jgi:hypothetical protein